MSQSIFHYCNKTLKAGYFIKKRGLSGLPLWRSGNHLKCEGLCCVTTWYSRRKGATICEGEQAYMPRCKRAGHSEAQLSLATYPWEKALTHSQRWCFHGLKALHRAPSAGLPSINIATLAGQTAHSQALEDTPKPQQFTVSTVMMHVTQNNSSSSVLLVNFTLNGNFFREKTFLRCSRKHLILSTPSSEHYNQTLTLDCKSEPLPQGAFPSTLPGCGTHS